MARGWKGGEFLTASLTEIHPCQKEEIFVLKFEILTSEGSENKLKQLPHH